MGALLTLVVGTGKVVLKAGVEEVIFDWINDAPPSFGNLVVNTDYFKKIRYQCLRGVVLPKK